MKLGELLNWWLENYIKGKRAEGTYLCYVGAIERVKNNKIELYLKEITLIKELEVQLFFYELSTTYAKSTINHLRSVINQSFRMAERNELIEKNPIHRLELPTNARVRKVNALTIFQQRHIESILKDDVLGFVVIFLLYTGLRRSEMVNLKWEDYDPRYNVIRVKKSKTKNGIREVPLTQKAKCIIEMQKSKSIHSEYIFLNTKGNPVTKSCLRKLFNRIYKKSLVKNFTPHVCRHTFATRCVEKGMDYKALSEILGHADVAFTLQRYASANIEFLQEQIKLLD